MTARLTSIAGRPLPSGMGMVTTRPCVSESGAEYPAGTVYQVGAGGVVNSDGRDYHEVVIRGRRERFSSRRRAR